MTNTFKSGDRVSVADVEEAEVVLDGLSDDLVKIRLADGTHHLISPALLTKLPNPDPEWKLGHVVKDAAGRTYFHTGDADGYAWRSNDTGRQFLVKNDRMYRPLTVVGVPVEERS